MASTSAPAASSAPPSLAKKPDWAPHIWEGCNLYAWFRLLFRNRFAIHWTCWHIAILATIFACMHSVLRFVQWLIYGRAIARTQITQPPIFLLGHWRSGTTLLHELFVQDPRMGFPTTYECMDPNHFLLTEGFFSKYLKFLTPSTRPMDNMKVGFDRPQEDEFALCMLGQPSPYLTIAFPNFPPQDQEYLDLEGIPEQKLASWKRSLLWFLKCITYKTGKRLVLKSPTHTARVKVLKAMFPDALFVHIVRDPFVIYSSTMNLWKTLYLTQGLAKPRLEHLEEHVFETYVRMHRRLEEGKALLDPKQFFEMRYEDLVADMEGMMRRIYDHFGLTGFDEHMQPNLRKYLEAEKDYKTNKYQLPPEKKAEVERRWGETIRQYGYGSPTGE
jgi:hypothetical protein